MKGKPQTWGPNEKGQMLAGATCAHCYAQVMGDWVKSSAKDSGQNEHRKAAVAVVTSIFDSHVCDPERLKALAEEKAKALEEDKNLKPEDWGPKLFAPAYTPNDPSATVH